MNKEHSVLTSAMPLVTLAAPAFGARGRGLRVILLHSAESHAEKCAAPQSSCQGSI